MKSKTCTLLKNQQECEDILILASKNLINGDTPLGRISRELIANTYRQWTDILTLIHCDEIDPWEVKDECEIIENPKQIPAVMLRVIENLENKEVCNA